MTPTPDSAAQGGAVIELAAAAQSVLAAMDKYNEANGTFLGGAPFFRLGRAIAAIRLASSPPASQAGVERWPDGSVKRRNEVGDVLHGCEVCDGDDECTCPGNVSGCKGFDLAPIAAKPRVERNAPGRPDSGGRVIVAFATDNQMDTILTALNRPSPPPSEDSASSTDGPTPAIPATSDTAGLSGGDEVGDQREALRKALEFACLTLAFIGRDQGTNRIDTTLDGLCEKAKELEPLVRAALAKSAT